VHRGCCQPEFSNRIVGNETGLETRSSETKSEVGDILELKVRCRISDLLQHHGPGSTRITLLVDETERTRTIAVNQGFDLKRLRNISVRQRTSLHPLPAMPVRNTESVQYLSSCARISYRYTKAVDINAQLWELHAVHNGVAGLSARRLSTLPKRSPKWLC
jgi:hypothetical protein